MSGALVIYGSMIVYGLYRWKKFDDVKFFWYLFPVSALLLTSILLWFSNTYLNLTYEMQVIQFHVATVVRIIAIVTLVGITIKKF